MSIAITVLALVTGVAAGAFFRLLQVPIPAPPNIAGILGIVGLYLGYQFVEYLDVGVDLLGAVGLR